MARGYKNPVLWLSPLGGWTKPSDVPLDVRVKQHHEVIYIYIVKQHHEVIDQGDTRIALWP